MIYCVEDDESIRELEVYTLQTMGMDAEGFSDGASFFESLKHGPLPDLVLLDIMLPDMDGLTVLKHLAQPCGDIGAACNYGDRKGDRIR